MKRCTKEQTKIDARQKFLVESMKRSYAELDSWSISIVHSKRQKLPRISLRGLSYHLPPDFFHQRCHALNLGLSTSKPMFCHLISMPHLKILLKNCIYEPEKLGTCLLLLNEHILCLHESKIPSTNINRPAKFNSLELLACPFQTVGRCLKSHRNNEC